MVSMAKNKIGPSRSRLAAWRGWVQTGFLFAWLAPGLQLHAICAPVFHCYSCPWALLGCPIGILANFSAIHVIPFAALGTLLAIGAVVGSFVCGWACPFGFLQDLIARIPTPKFALPAWLGFVRYVVLIALVLVLPYFWGEDKNPLFFCRFCPAGALEAAVPNVVRLAWAHQPVVWPVMKLAILGVFLITSLFTWRPWCTLFCPLGAIYALLNHVSLVYLRFHRDRCGGCGDCRSLCHDATPAEGRLDGLRCVRCLECTRCRAVTVETALTEAK
jgi:ferredoxin-type protein NapH